MFIVQACGSWIQAHKLRIVIQLFYQLYFSVQPSWLFLFYSITCWCQQWLHLNSTLRINSSLLYQICYCHMPYNLFLSFCNYLLMLAVARSKPSNLGSIVICYTTPLLSLYRHFLLMLGCQGQQLVDSNLQIYHYYSTVPPTPPTVLQHPSVVDFFVFFNYLLVSAVATFELHTQDQ